MTSDREIQEERRQIIRQDREFRDNAKRHGASTLHERAITEVGSELGGRFAKLGRERQIVGAQPIAYPKLPSSSPWASSLPCEEPLSDQSDCADVLGYPIDGNEQATSAPSTPYAQTGRRGSHALASPPVERSSASPGGVSNQPNFRRRL
jgi:hypothetical protein